MLADFDKGDEETALDVLQAFNTAIQTDSAHETKLGKREILNIIAGQSTSTGSITEHAIIQNMLNSHVEEYNKDTDELLAMNIQKDINIFTNENLERDLKRLQETKDKTRGNVQKKRQYFLSKRYAAEQNKYAVVSVQIAFWMEAVLFLILTMNAEGYIGKVVTGIFCAIVVVCYLVLMYKIVKQNADRRTDVFDKFYWSSTSVPTA